MIEWVRKTPVEAISCAILFLSLKIGSIKANMMNLFLRSLMHIGSTCFETVLIMAELACGYLGFQLLWAAFLPAFWGIPAWHGTSVHGFFTVYGGWQWCKEFQLQLGGRCQWTEVDLAGSASQHSWQSSQSARQPWRSNYSKEYGTIFLWWRSKRAQTSCHRSDLEGTVELIVPPNCLTMPNDMVLSWNRLSNLWCRSIM